MSTSDAALAPAGKRSTSTSILVQYIREEFPGVQIEPVGRRYWNDAGGKLTEGDMLHKILSHLQD